MAQCSRGIRAAPEVACPDSVVLQIGPEEEETKHTAVSDAGVGAAARAAAVPGILPVQRRQASSASMRSDQHLPMGEPLTQEFEVFIAKGSEELGVDVLQQGPDTLLIIKVKPGPLAVWNQTHSELRVQPGDRFVAANGCQGSARDLIAAIKADGSLRLRVRRLLEFSISVRRAATLGIDVSRHRCGLLILHVGSGPFEDWNATASFDRQVRPGDYIVEVNGCRGGHADLLAAIQRSGPRLNVVLSREFEQPGHHVLEQRVMAEGPKSQEQAGPG